MPVLAINRMALTNSGTRKASLLPVQLSIPVTDGRLALGTWQGIYLFEHRDRPHQRHVAAHLSQ